MSTKKIPSISNLNNQNAFIPISASPNNSTRRKRRKPNSNRSLSVPVDTFIPVNPEPPMDRDINPTSNVKKPPLTLIHPDDLERGIFEEMLDREHALTREQKILNAIKRNKETGRYTPIEFYPNHPARPQSYPIFPLDKFQAENEHIRRDRQGLNFNGGKSKKRKLAKRKKKGTRKRSNKKK